MPVAILPCGNSCPDWRAAERARLMGRRPAMPPGWQCSWSAKLYPACSRVAPRPARNPVCKEAAPGLRGEPHPACEGVAPANQQWANQCALARQSRCRLGLPARLRWCIAQLAPSAVELSAGALPSWHPALLSSAVSSALSSTALLSSALVHCAAGTQRCRAELRLASKPLRG
eukprot:317004-Chlamydomonas_euryale.AAC.5